MTDQADLQALSDAATDRIETITSLGTKVRRGNPAEYRKVATVQAGQALRKGIIPTLEGPHSYEAGDYICGPGQGGEFWPVKRSIFEATYVPAASPSPDTDAGLDVERLANAMELVRMNWFMLWRSGDNQAIARKVAAEYARLATPDKEQPETSDG